MSFPSWLRALLPHPGRSRAARKPARSPRPTRAAPAKPSVEPLEDRTVPSAMADCLLIGDQGDPADPTDDVIRRFDATTGEYLGTFTEPGGGGLNGPRGLIFRNPGTLLVVNQNVNQPGRGEILRYDGDTGAFRDALVPFTDANAPFAPRGMVLNDGILYVANVQTADDPDASGNISLYNANNGKFLGTFDADCLGGAKFNPRGVVFGPGGDLYVSAFDPANSLVGHVLRFDVTTGDCSIVATNDGDGVTEPGELADLHRPEGLVFGPDGNLYVTSFRADANDTDKILVLNPTTGAEVGQIDLDQVGQPRAFAQAILFGPGGDLFVPITGNGPDTGSVRRYDVRTGTYEVFIAPNSRGGALVSPWYLTFCQTDPATLAYNPKDGAKQSARGSASLSDAALTVREA